MATTKDRVLEILKRALARMALDPSTRLKTALRDAALEYAAETLASTATRGARSAPSAAATKTLAKEFLGDVRTALA